MAMQTARTVPKGVGQAGIAVGPYRGTDVFATSDVATRRTQPTFTVFARSGMNDWSDCGVQIFSFGGKADCKLQVLKTQRLDVGFAPGIGYTTSFLSSHHLDAYLQALVGLNLGAEPFEEGAVSLVGSLTPIGRCFVAEGSPGQGCYAQLAYSSALSVQVTSSIGLHAEVAWMRAPFAAPANFGLLGESFWQFMIGAVFTRRDEERR